MKTFHEEEKLEKYMDTKTSLQKILKEIPHTDE
jgi:hypothetical protein